MSTRYSGEKLLCEKKILDMKTFFWCWSVLVVVKGNVTCLSIIEARHWSDTFKNYYEEAVASVLENWGYIYIHIYIYIYIWKSDIVADDTIKTQII